MVFKKKVKSILALTLGISLVAVETMPVFAQHRAGYSEYMSEIISSEDLSSLEEDYLSSKAVEFVPGYVEVPGRETPKVLEDSISYGDIVSGFDSDHAVMDKQELESLCSVAEESAYPLSYTTPEALKNYLDNNYPKVRNQNPYGSCWAHSAMGLAEFYMIKNSMATKDVDLSELHLAYYTYRQGSPSIAGDTGDTVTSGDFMNSGGNIEYAAQTLLRQRGAVDEDKVPYSDASKVLQNGLSSDYERDYNTVYLKNAYQININNVDLVKQNIVKNGLGGVSINADDNYYDSTNKSYYCPVVTESNHAVSIVGWDDDFPKENFSSSFSKPSSNGAWLIRNSWNYGLESGYPDMDTLGYSNYFWISYEDKSLSDSVWFYDMTPVSGFPENNYYYDSQIHGISYSSYSGDSGCYSANIYTANGDASYEDIKAVSFGVSAIGSGGTPYKVMVYTNVDSSKGPFSGKLESEATVSGSLYYNGYYTIDLKKAVRVAHGNTFSVVVYRGDGVTVNIENAANGVNYQANVGAGSSQSFFNNVPLNNYYLTDVGKTRGANMVISALTDDVSGSTVQQAASPASSYASGASLEVGNVIKLSSTTSGASIYYTSDGSTPDTGSTLYSSEGIEITEDMAGSSLTIKAIAIADGYENSDVSTFTYKIAEDKSSLNLSKTDVEIIGINNTETITATVRNAKGNIDENAVVDFLCSDPSVAKLTESGQSVIITALEKGSAVITAKSGEHTAECKVTVSLSKASKPTATPASGSILYVGNTIKLLSESDTAKIFYTLDGSKPSESSLVYGSEGIAVTKEMAGKNLVIRAFAADTDQENSDEIRLEYSVENKAGIILDKEIITGDTLGGSEIISATVVDESGEVVSSPDIIWASSDPKVARVEKTEDSACGKVIFISDGTAEIMASYNDISEVCQVTVIQARTSIPEANPLSGELSVGDSIELSCTEPEAKIYYELGDSQVTDDSILYDNKGITVTEDMAGKDLIVKAMAKKEGWKESETVTFSYTVKEKTIVPARISVSPESVTFTSKSESKQLQVLVWDTEGKEIENADITYYSASESVALVSDKGLITAVGKGDTTIRVSCGNISTTVYVKADIKSEEPEEESGIGVEGLEDKYVYTGAKIEPSIIVKDYDRSVTLVKNVDYTVKYYNNNRIGTATFLVNGKGNYIGKLFEGSFEIVSVQKDIDPEEIESLANLKGVKIKKPEAVTYTGEELYPESLQLTFNKKNSITYYLNDEGTYETENGDTIPAIVAISNNVNKGTASILLAGSDNTSVKSTFKINPVDLSKAAEGDLNIEVEEGIYAVKGAVPVVTVTYKGQELAEGLDYSIKYSYNNNKNVGNAAGKVLITGKGNFSKKAKAVDFDINAFEIDENSVNAVNAYKGIKAGAIKICMLDQNGTLIPAKQFEVKVSDDAGNELESKDKLEEGSYTLTVLPKSDNLSGRATLDINVTENNIAKTSINGYIIKSYTGEAITLDGDDFSEIAILNKNKVELIYGEDYEVAGYINNVNKGTMRVIIKGINDYCGIKEIKVKINAKE